MIPVKAGDSIVILTGAGISAESGIQTFRGSDGLWCGHRIEDVATPEAFTRNPALVNTFYNQRRQQLLDVSIAPNAAHTALSNLESDWTGHVHVITQNIDNLHERSGTKKLIHMHGELLRMFCTFCKIYDDIISDISLDLSCTNCRKTSSLRPDIVWFGEMPYEMDRIHHLLNDCNLFIAIGTSGNVYPAAGFSHTARVGGAYCIEMNIEESLVASTFHAHIIGPASQTVPALVAEILNRKTL